MCPNYFKRHSLLFMLEFAKPVGLHSLSSSFSVYLFICLFLWFVNFFIYLSFILFTYVM